MEKQLENRVEFTTKEFLVWLKSPEISKLAIEILYKNWLRQKAEHIFTEKIGKYAVQVGVTIEKIIIKSLRNRWGSLTKDGKAINLNLSLLMAPEDVIDYIILHELCHLKIKEHSHRYWNLVRKYVPNYQDKIKWLNVNVAILI